MIDMTRLKSQVKRSLHVSTSGEPGSPDDVASPSSPTPCVC